MSLFLLFPFSIVFPAIVLSFYCLPFYCSLFLLSSLPLFSFLIVSSIYRDLDAMLFPSASYIAFRSVVTYSYNLSFLHCIQIVLSALRILVLKLSFQHFPPFTRWPSFSLRMLTRYRGHCRETNTSRCLN